MSTWLTRRSRIFWYDQYALNEQATAFAKYDPDRITRELLRTGADIIAVYAANQFSVAYYPSAIWPQHPGLRGRDYVGDLTTRLKKHGKKIIIYTNWLDSKRPEWWPKLLETKASWNDELPPLASWADASNPDHAVRVLAGAKWKTPCSNSPKREQIVAIAREVIERYKPDAFHVDMLLFWGICVCDYCRPSLEKICGTKDVTREAVEKHWNAYVDWRAERTSSLLAEVASVARASGVAFTPNPFAPPFMSTTYGPVKEWLPSLDVFLSECFDAFSWAHTDLNSTSFLVRWQHAVGKPAWIIRTSGQFHYSHWPISKAQWEIYAAACMANGCAAFGPCGIGARPDTTNAPSMLENIKHGFDFYMRDADLAENATSAARVALAFSWQTRQYAPPGEHHTAWVEEMAGWNRLLIEEHIPFDVLVAENVTDAAQLSRYDLLVLPALTHLSPAFCEAVRRFVKAGGRVIVTGATSLYSDRGAALDDFALADVLGASRKGEDKSPFAIEHKRDGAPAAGVFQQIESRGKTIVKRFDTDPAGSVGGVKDPMPVAASRWPAVTQHKFGKGAAIYAAFEIGRYFETHGDEHIGDVMAEMVNRALPRRQIVVRAPRTLEVTVWEQPAPTPRTIIHLANRTVPWSLPTAARQPTEVIPLHGVEIEIDTPYAKPRVSGRQVSLATRAARGKLRITIDKLGPYGAIVIEPGNKPKRRQR